MTAANVAYGFWSHDIEGPANNPEMFVSPLIFAVVAYSLVQLAPLQTATKSLCQGAFTVHRSVFIGIAGCLR
jgi:hypothetical protein